MFGRGIIEISWSATGPVVRAMRFLRITIALLLCACSSSLPVAAQTPPPSEADRTAEFLFDPYDPPINRSIAYEDAVEKLKERFGVPEKTTSEVAIDHRDPTVTAEFLVWYYDGLTIHLQGAVDEEGRWITQMELVGDNYHLKYGLGLKKHRRDFLGILRPDLLNNDDRRIRFSSEYWDSGVFAGQGFDVRTNSILVVEFDADGKATKLTWSYYAD